MTTKSFYPLFMLMVFFIVLFFAKQNSSRLKEIRQHKIDKLERENKLRQDILERENSKRKLFIYSRMMMESPNFQSHILHIFSLRYQRCYDNDDMRDIHKKFNENNLIKGSTSSPYDRNDKIVKFRDKSTAKNPSQVNKPIDNIHGSNSIVYIVVIFLLVSLVRAAIDISNQIKKNKERDQDEFSRRCSLQEFAQSRHKNLSKKKRHSHQPSTNSSPPSTPALTDSNKKFFSFSRFFDGNRKIFESSPSFYTDVIPSSVASTILPEHTKVKPPLLVHPINPSPIPSEPGSPAKFHQSEKVLIGGRPVPLTRRQSFPAVMMSHQYGSAAQFVRRPSMDSLSEGDSSPDVKRRVRMIHRH